MDHQGLIVKVPAEQLDAYRAWLDPTAIGLDKADMKTMLRNLRSGQWTLWRFRAPSEGVAVSYPLQEQLFIYYLHADAFLDRLTKEDLFKVSRREGFKGYRCETEKRGVKRLLERVGFRTISDHGDWWELELQDGQV